MKAVSLSNEIITLQRAIEGAATLAELGRQGGLEDEDTEALISAILALVSCRMRDLGRAARGTLNVELFWAPHNAAIEVPGEQDVLMRLTAPVAKRKR